ncbi:sensor histidine kinase [Geomesophilobacter sediminis]|uniref:histidine kinase n=1 Tax=Geomesophilobacter sediminis TaxID=2798584 RepID=A0A8J7LUV4_9BACT|nr:ATP-binding protein [Geomesophilobacter sediminis]MBJ6724180.1 PAS domain S-box protein [Geomesophilobacter sediminis]
MEILLIEHNLFEARLIKKMLVESRRGEYVVQYVQKLTDALPLLQTASFDAILVDAVLADSTGTVTARTLRQQCGSTPIIFLSASNNAEVGLDLLHLDIQDYLIKAELNSNLLSRSICYAIERKRNEAALRASEAKLSTIFQAMPVAVSIATLSEGKYIQINDEFARIFEFERGEAIGFSPLELGIWYPEAREKLVRALQQQGAVRNVEARLKSKSGRKIVGLLSMEEIVIADEKCVVTITRDITEQKEAETEIRNLNRRLTARARALKSANRDIESFNSMVAHDLRSPLSVVNSYCQAIKMQCGDKLETECREYLQEAYEGTLRMDQLIEALLTFSRVGNVKLQREEVDLSALAEQVYAELKFAEPERPVNFRSAEGLQCYGDTGLLRIVLENLLGNAWKWTRTREPAVISFAQRETGGTPTFLVRDNGLGFDMKHANELFVPFFRVPGAEAQKGFGIGLATVKRIVERHGGKVWGEAVPGSGATFYFTISRPAVIERTAGRGGGVHEDPDRRG